MKIVYLLLNHCPRILILFLKSLMRNFILLLNAPLSFINGELIDIQLVKKKYFIKKVQNNIKSKSNFTNFKQKSFNC